MLKLLPPPKFNKLLRLLLALFGLFTSVDENKLLLALLIRLAAVVVVVDELPVAADADESRLLAVAMADEDVLAIIGIAGVIDLLPPPVVVVVELVVLAARGLNNIERFVAALYT